jgi:hypothetical protein
MGNEKIDMNQQALQSQQTFTSSSFGVIGRIYCGSHDCTDPAALGLGMHLFCLNHFVLHCHARLEEYQQECRLHLVLAEDRRTIILRFLEECMSKVAALLMARPELANIDRARLLDILLWAAEVDLRCR